MDGDLITITNWVRVLTIERMNSNQLRLTLKIIKESSIFHAAIL
jgi:hypothetical protein